MLLYVFYYQDNQTQKEAGLSLKELQQELQRCMEECVQLKEKLAKTEADLRTTLEEWVQTISHSLKTCADAYNVLFWDILVIVICGKCLFSISQVFSHRSELHCLSR